MAPRHDDWRPFTARVTVDWLRAEPDRIHRRLGGSLVSADLSGFTAMSERLASLGREGAERLTGIVNSCFEALIAIAESEGGDVLKFGGDALLIWYAGDHSARDAARACARMQRAIAAPRFARLGLRMSVGAHTGEFDMFLVGEPGWRELVLAGSPVTRTVELEAAAEAGQILVSPELADRLPPRWRGRATGGGVLLEPPMLRRPDPRLGEPEGRAPDVLVSPGLRDDIRALAALGGEHRIATICFLEVEHTDDRLALIGPDEFALSVDSLVRTSQRLQRVYGVQLLYTDVIANGVKLIASAGAPRSTVNDDEAALRYTVDIVHGDPQHKLKGGVNRGRVFAGFLGAERRHTYTVMGDPVNLAARLMAHARPGQVVASVDVIDSARVEVTTDDLPPFLVKGKAEPIRARVVREIGATRADVDNGRLPLVGRAPELAVLSGWVGDAVEGRGRAVEISGPAGIGKSRLIAEVGADGRLFARVTVQCLPYDASAPYAAAKVILRRLLGIQHGATAEEAGAALARTVGRVRPGLLPYLPLLATPVGATVPPTAEASAIAAEFIVPRTHDVVIDLMTVVVATPTLIVVEDAYYADDASAALLRALAAVIDESPWLLVAAGRPGMTGPLAEAAGVERLELAPLSPEAVAELASTALGDAGSPGVDLSAADRADGNPFFVLQLMAAVRAGVEADDLPESVERVIAERLDRLVPEDRTLLRYAAVLGPRFDPKLLGLVIAGSEPSTPATRWDRVSDLIEIESERVGRFRHLLYRDVAYEALPFARRARLHQRVGELLEASGYADDVALLAEHFFRAGDAERTWRYSVAAGDRAWQQMAVVEAISAYERAVAVRRRLRGLRPAAVARVLEALGDAHERNADYAAAEAAYRRVSRGTADVDARRLLRKRGMLREKVGRFGLAMRWYERGLGPAGVDGAGPGDGALLVAAAGALLRLGRAGTALDVAERAARRATADGDLVAEAHAFLVAQASSDELGRFDPSYAERSLDLFVQLGDTLYQGKALNNLGAAHYFAGDWSAAAGHYRSAVVRFEAAGDVVEAAVARSNLAEIRSDQGFPAEAAEGFTGSLRVFERSGYAVGKAFAQANLGRALARADPDADGPAVLADALDQFVAIGAENFVVETRLRIAEAMLLSGRTTEALEALATAEAGVREGRGFPGSDAFAARLRCWAHRQEGRTGAALYAAREAVELAAAAGARFERTASLNEVAALTGDPSVAAEVAAELDALGVVRLPVLPVPL